MRFYFDKSTLNWFNSNSSLLSKFLKIFLISFRLLKTITAKRVTEPKSATKKCSTFWKCHSCHCNASLSLWPHHFEMHRKVVSSIFLAAMANEKTKNKSSPYCGQHVRFQQKHIKFISSFVSSALWFGLQCCCCCLFIIFKWRWECHSCKTFFGFSKTFGKRNEFQKFSRVFRELYDQSGFLISRNREQKSYATKTECAHIHTNISSQRQRSEIKKQSVLVKQERVCACR